MDVGWWLGHESKPSPAVYYSLLQAASTLSPSPMGVASKLCLATRNPIHDHTSLPTALLPLHEQPRDSSWTN